METNTNIFQNTAVNPVVIKENIAIDLANPEHIFSFLNVTQDHIGEKPLSAGVLRLHSACKRAPIGMSVIRVEDGTVLLSNPAMQRLLGYTKKELTGMPFTQFTHPDDVEKQKAAYLKIKNGQRVSFDMKKQYIRKDGTSFPARLISTVIRRSKGKPAVTIGMIMESK